MARLYTPPFETVAQYFRSADVHDVHRVEDADTLISLVFSLLWTVLHGILTYWVFWGELGFAYGLVLHVLLAGILAIVTLVLRGMGRDIRHLYVLAVASTAAGIFGAGGVLLCVLLNIIYTRFALPFAEWYRAIYPDFGVTHEQELYDLITMRKDEASAQYSVVSFLDIMALGSEAQKRRAITRMTDRFHPQFAPAYRRALEDPSNAIRVQAASSITKIERQFVSTLMQLERLEKRKSNDAQLTLGLARYYDAYAFTGLLDEEREAENRVRALQKYKEYLEEKPNDIDARMEAARLLLRCREYQQVISLLRECMDAGYDNDAIKLWMLEALYAAGRFTELRHMAPSCAGFTEWLKDVRPRLARSVTAWASAGDNTAQVATGGKA